MIKSNCGNVVITVITVIVVVAIMQYRVHTKKTFNHSILAHGVPKGGQKEKKLSGFGVCIFGIGIPTEFRL